VNIIIENLKEYVFDKVLNVVLSRNEYGYINNKKINKKIVCNEFPCDNDIFFAYVILYLNHWICNKSNIIAALVFKWINEQTIYVKEENNKIYFIVNDVNIISDRIEKELFKNIFSISNNGILELPMLEQYVIDNDMYISSMIKKMYINVMRFLQKRKFLYKTENNSSKKINTMSDDLYGLAQQLYGLKNYIDKFTNDSFVDEKMKLQYVCYACIFGNVDKIDIDLANKIKRINIKNKIIKLEE